MSSSPAAAAAVVHFPPATIKDTLGILSKLTESGIFGDVRLVCSDGVGLLWSRFLLAANSSFLASCFRDLDVLQEDVVTLVMPDISSSTLGSMLKCTLNYAVRRDTLSVNEQEVMTLLGFTLRDPLNTATSQDLGLVTADVVRTPPPPPPPPSSSIVAAKSEVFEVDSVFNDIPIQGLDIRSDIDSISMVSIEGGPNLFGGNDDPQQQEQQQVATDSSAEAKTTTTTTAFKCGQCGASFSRSQHLEQHVAGHGQSGSFVCEQCGKRFHHANNLKDHQRYHQDRLNVLECPTCQRKLKGRRALKNHEERFHNRESCPVCGKRLAKRDLAQHVREEHPGAAAAESAKFSCDGCSKVHTWTDAIGRKKNKNGLFCKIIYF